jgi:hypothetical protein
MEVKFVARDYDSVGNCLVLFPPSPLPSISHNITELSVFGNSEEYEWLHVLDFTSERKRMSVVVRDRNTGHLRLYTKVFFFLVFSSRFILCVGC